MVFLLVLRMTGENSGRWRAPLSETDRPLDRERLPDINAISLRAPFDWLAAGWRDFLSVPGLSLFYGAVLALISAAIFWALYATGSASWFYALLGGFLLVGPLLGMGLYAAARELAAGRTPGWRDVFWVRDAARTETLLLGLLLVFLYFLWTRIAQVIYALSTWRVHWERQEFLDFVLFDPGGQAMVIAGLVTGGIVAFCNFSLAAIAAPMLLDRRFNVFMALATSVRCVNGNFFPMLLWAFLISALSLLGILMAFAGLAVIFPVIGMASWHAYRALVKA
jgi:uncharacterized membrane protein